MQAVMQQVKALSTDEKERNRGGAGARPAKIALPDSLVPEHVISVEFE